MSIGSELDPRESDPPMPVSSAAAAAAFASSAAAPNPCLWCGACCVLFRVSFYWSEADDATPGGVPVELTEKLDPWRRVMRGTNARQPRCLALCGIVGRDVMCAVYAQRPSVCREFEPSWAHGSRNPQCDRARERIGLLPLAPDAWAAPARTPRAA